ncbi:MAG: flippase-like domain-containing protein [Bacteriovoracaceae bacterium]|nr:flippase-like domain-containing protein [Bacteriovoracaceae bacterium]
MVKLAIKIAIAVALIAWLTSSGKIDFSLLLKSTDNLSDWLICLLLLSTNIVLTTFRWRWLLHLKSEVKFTFLQIIKLTWIGLLFNSVLPGVVSGDIIKLVYAKDIDESIPKSYLVTTVLIDRIFGLCGILILLGISTAFKYTELVAKSSELKTLIHFNFVLFIGVLFFLGTLFFPKSWQDFILEKSKKIKLLETLLQKTLAQFWHIGANRAVVFKCLTLSVVVQCSQVLAFYTVTKPFYDNPLSLASAFTFIPVGIVTIAIPITPSGLGIGHAIFDKLFSLYGVNGGASLFNFYFVAVTFMNLFGIIPYLTSGKRHSSKDAKGFVSSK